MNLVAYARLLHMKINSAHNKAKNPFYGAGISYNPFSRPVYKTVVWVEADKDSGDDKNNMRVG